MKRMIVLVLSLALLLTAGLLFLHCGSESECDCGTRVCGSPPGDTCSCGTCEAGKVCNNTGQCEDEETCCTNQQVYASGVVMALAAPPAPVKVALTPISPMDAFTNPDPVHLADTVSGTDGTFQTDCFDATRVALGLVILADDQGFDRTGGTYYPTGTVVKAWSAPSERVCVTDAKVFTVPAATVTTLGNLPDFDAATNGFIMGIVADTSGNPIAGAKVVRAGGGSALNVLYPSVDFSDFTGPSTSASGIYLIPGPLGLSQVTAEATGHTFGTNSAASKGEFCYFLILQAQT